MKLCNFPRSDKLPEKMLLFFTRISIYWIFRALVNLDQGHIFISAVKYFQKQTKKQNNNNSILLYFYRV